MKTFRHNLSQIFHEEKAQGVIRMIARSGGTLSTLRRGLKGERMVKDILEKLNVKEYWIYNDIMIRSANGKLTQIDHLVVSYYGIFIIETKYYFGQIYGTDEDYRWKCRKGKREVMFYNPVKQVMNHKRTLSKILKLQIDLEALVCFTGAPVLKVRATSIPIIHVKGLIKHLRKYRKPLMTIHDIKYVLRVLDKHIVTGRYYRRKHIQHIRGTIKDWRY